MFKYLKQRILKFIEMKRNKEEILTLDKIIELVQKQLREDMSTTDEELLIAIRDAEIRRERFRRVLNSAAYGLQGKGR